MSIRSVFDETVLECIIEELLRKFFFVGEDGVSMFLVGVQLKVGVYVDGDCVIVIFMDGVLLIWILKFDAKSLSGGVYNEVLCLRLVFLVGIDVLEVKVGCVGAWQYLLVKRYDCC